MAGGSQVALVTGAGGAIGQAIVKALASCPDFQVWAVCRTFNQATTLADKISSQTGGKVKGLSCDLANPAAIQELRRQFSGPLHVLINNAATTPPDRQENAEGLEMQFAVNVLGYFRMIHAFKDVLALSASARVVNVASYWAGDMDLSDLQFLRRPYNNNTAYRQSKQADRMLSAKFARILADDRITVNACHPGDVPSRLSHDLGFGGHETPVEGAATPVWLAKDASVANTTGEYWENRQKTTCRFSRDQEGVDQLYRILCKQDSIT